jgi:hypothetical protein
MPSNGHRLLHEVGLRQGSFFKASLIEEELRKQWIDSRPEEKRRKWRKNNRITDQDILVVVSQDCDIACADDNHDPLVEIAVCSPIDNPHPGSTFAYSARKIHFGTESGWFEAKVSNLIYVPKGALLEQITPEYVSELPDITKKTIPQWRALRYRRTALPDAFNAKFKPLESDFTQKLDEVGRGYVRAVYIHLNSYQEEESYEFELLALLSADTSDEQVSMAVDIVEGVVAQLEASGAGSAKDGGDLTFAARADQVSVNEIDQMVRVNFDSISLESGDDDVEVGD